MDRSHCIDKSLETLDKLDHVAALVMSIEHAQQPQVLVRLKEKLAHEHELREDIRN